MAEEKAKGDIKLKEIQKEESRLEQLAGFPGFTKSYELDEPIYKQMGYLAGDILSAPGRVLRADLKTPENTKEDFLRKMAETEPTSDEWYKKMGEGVLQSPATPFMIGTAPVSMPALMATGALGGAADVAYSDSDAELMDYIMSGGTGAALGPAGKGIGSLAKKGLEKITPSLPGVLQKTGEILTEGTPKIKKSVLQKNMVYKNQPDFSLEKWLYQSGYDKSKLTKKQLSNVLDMIKKGLPDIEIKKYLSILPDIKLPKNMSIERGYDIGSRPVGIELGDIMMDQPDSLMMMSQPDSLKIKPR